MAKAQAIESFFRFFMPPTWISVCLCKCHHCSPLKNFSIFFSLVSASSWQFYWHFVLCICLLLHCVCLRSKATTQASFSARSGIGRLQRRGIERPKAVPDDEKHTRRLMARGGNKTRCVTIEGRCLLGCHQCQQRDD